LGILEHVAHILRRSGLFISRVEKSICFCGQSTADFEGAMGLMNDVRRELKPNKLLLCSPDPVTCNWLRTHFPGSRVVPPPWHFRWLVRRYFKCLDPVIFFCIQLDQYLPLGMLERARRLGIPVIGVGANLNGPARFMRQAIPLFDRFFVRSHEEADKIESLCGPETVVSRQPADHPDSAESRAVILEGIKHFFTQVPRRELHSHYKRRRFLHFSQGRLGTFIASKRSGRRIGSWNNLRDRLGCPESIFCLGNGPSSEDPAVLEVRFDCLMRVNHRWMSRGILTNPDMVFAGSLSTTLSVPPCVFGFRTIRKEQEILLRHFLLGLRFRQIEYFTLERVASGAYSHTRWSLNPTNGAIMIATAARLRPSRIVIAGMDLFADPRGRYPGETNAENEYFSSHARDVDVAVIDEALSGFEGSIEILSPGLELALKERRSRAASDVFMPEPAR